MTNEPDTHRRTFLALTALGAAASFAPRAEATGEQTPRKASLLAGARVPLGAPHRPGWLAEQLLAAQALGKPLMVIVRPPLLVADDHGWLWGETFANANDATFADFGLCEWVCASHEDLLAHDKAFEAEVVPDLMAVLFETHHGKVPKAWIRAPGPEWVPLADELEFDLDFLRRVEELTNALRKAILPDARALSRRHSESLEAVSSDEVEWDRLESGRRVRLSMVTRHAASFHPAYSPRDERSVLRASLAAQAFAVRVWETAPEGARWIPAPSRNCSGCGMGRASRRTRDFLAFYVSQDAR